MAAEDWIDEFGPDEFDDDYYDDAAPTGYSRGPRRDKVCLYCGVGELHWGNHNGKWRLFDDEGALHSCVFIRGKPGRGKSRIVRKAADMQGIAVIDDISAYNLAEDHLINDTIRKLFNPRRTAMLRKKAIVYVTDTGHEFALEEMKATHLLNTIAHINKKIDTLNDIPQCLADAKTGTAMGYLAKRLDTLIESRNALALELAALVTRPRTRSTKKSTVRPVQTTAAWYRAVHDKICPRLAFYSEKPDYYDEVY